MKARAMADMLVASGRISSLKREDERLLDKFDSCVEDNKDIVNIGWLVKFIGINSYRKLFIELLRKIMCILNFNTDLYNKQLCIDRLRNNIEVHRKYLIRNNDNILMNMSIDLLYIDRMNSIEQIYATILSNCIIQVLFDNHKIKWDNRIYELRRVKKIGYNYFTIEDVKDKKESKLILGMLVILKDGALRLYTDSDIEDGDDKIKIIKEIGLDKIDLVITMKNSKDGDWIDKLVEI